MSTPATPAPSQTTDIVHGTGGPPFDGGVSPSSLGGNGHFNTTGLEIGVIVGVVVVVLITVIWIFMWRARKNRNVKDSEIGGEGEAADGVDAQQQPPVPLKNGVQHPTCVESEPCLLVQEQPSNRDRGSSQKLWRTHPSGDEGEQHEIVNRA